MVEKYRITKKEEVYNLLKEKRNFKYMSESLIRKLINEMNVMRFTKKTLLLKQDAENRFIYIIIKGKVTIYLEKKPLYTLCRTGDVFGELSFATQSPSTASIVAEEGLGAMAISFNYLKKLNDSEFGFWLCRVLGEKLIRTSKLKTSRTDENIDELETAPFKPNTGHEANGGGNEKAETAAEEVEVAETDIEIEDVLGDDDANLDNAVEDSDEVEGENVTAGDDGDEVPDKVDSPAAADDEEDDDGEFMDMNFEP